MADLGNRANVNSAIDLLLDDLQPDEAIQPSDHNTLLKDILDTLANGLSTILRTSGQTNGENITINGGSQLLFNNVFDGDLQSDTLSAVRNWILPNASGTIALLSDIPSSESIYTADGTLTGNRTVDIGNTNDLIFENSGASSNFKISTAGNSYSLFNRSGGLKIRPDTLDPIVVTNTVETLDTFTVKKNGGGSWSAYNGVKIGELTSNDFAQFTIDDLNFYKANIIQHKIGFGVNTSDVDFWVNGATANNSFRVGGSNLIDLETISLKGKTIIQGDGTSTGTTLALYNSDTTPVKLWDFLDNGTLNKGDTLLNIGNSNSITGGSTSYAIGWNNNISGGVFGKLAIGDSNVLNGSNSYTVGRYNNIQSNNTFQFGNFLSSTAQGSFIIGHGVYTDSAQKLVNNTADSLALGWNSTTPQYLFASTGASIDATLDMNNNRILNTVVNPSVQETTSTATFTINADEETTGVLTAISLATTMASPTGTPVQGQKLTFRFKDNGTAQSLTWNAIFRAIGLTLPTTTTANKTIYIGCIYNSTETKWDVIAIKEEV